MRTFNVPVATARALSADFNTVAIPLKNIFMYSIAFIVTGTPTGTVKLQASNDPETNDTIPLPNPAHWVDIANSSFSLTTSGETLWNVTSCAYNYVRLVYTDGSSGVSTATAAIVFCGKGA